MVSKTCTHSLGVRKETKYTVMKTDRMLLKIAVLQEPKFQCYLAISQQKSVMMMGGSKNGPERKIPAG